MGNSSLQDLYPVPMFSARQEAVESKGVEVRVVDGCVVCQTITGDQYICPVTDLQLTFLFLLAITTIFT